MANHDEERSLTLTKKKLADIMKEIDFCMMTTLQSNGQLSSRPMSNNSNVEWDGDTWFFASKDSMQVQEISEHANLNLSYAVPDEILFISIEGRGEIVEDVEKKKALWEKELERWFPGGPEDDEVVLIRVVGEYAAIWSKEGDATLDL
ncbi:MAG: pyridoxamine 5'-phosphate oxidase family protein [Anaerolineales bacterium]|nr:pyridoxamine 5'-phosphate oxidase family protein [Anaerolineales bacterium]MCB9126412.1 pyridoxamine 5'-phosphate oxidase family protein [Ardenticatenales bacterium]MCB9171573.1 pyridoxamine 5'-phosphate oxidase family protein [Ardenticatenales bacterium]